jgi:Transcriptional regulator containing an amidase domain and an AraC-type DNA-binding HTH domain
MGENPLVTQIKKIMLESLVEGDLSLLLLARRCDLPVRSLQRHLHAAGTSYTCLLQAVRLQRASTLLINTMMPIADITKDLGFSDASNFSRAFYCWTGVSPSAFRQYGGASDNGAR